MNEEPPEELATVVRKNAQMSVRKRLQKLCDTILADPTGKIKKNILKTIFKNVNFSLNRSTNTK